VTHEAFASLGTPRAQDDGAIALSMRRAIVSMVSANAVTESKAPSSPHPAMYRYENARLWSCRWRPVWFVASAASDAGLHGSALSGQAA
jgi:hypothetical protein